MEGSPTPTILGVLVRGWKELFVSDSSLYAPSYVSNMSEIFLILTLVSSSLEVRSEACLFSVIERKRKIVSQKCFTTHIYKTDNKKLSSTDESKKKDSVLTKILCAFYVLGQSRNCVCSMFYLTDMLSG